MPIFTRHNKDNWVMICKGVLTREMLNQYLEKSDRQHYAWVFEETDINYSKLHT
jgi:hypothetical protein